VSILAYPAILAEAAMMAVAAMMSNTRATPSFCSLVAVKAFHLKNADVLPRKEIGLVGHA